MLLFDSTSAPASAFAAFGAGSLPPPSAASFSSTGAPPTPLDILADRATALGRVLSSTGAELFVRRALAVASAPGGGGGGSSGGGGGDCESTLGGGGHRHARHGRGGVSYVSSSSAHAPPASRHSGGGAATATASSSSSAAADERVTDADRAALRDWGFDPWAHPLSHLQRLAVCAFASRGLLDRFDIPWSKCASFVADVASRYRDVPFHGFRHAWTVLHAAWLLLEHSDLEETLLDEVEVLALLLAALCHDVDHPGTNKCAAATTHAVLLSFITLTRLLVVQSSSSHRFSAFQVNSSSPLALRYSDRSVLEQHHCSTTFAVLEHTQLVAHLPADDLRALRRTIIAAILAADVRRRRRSRASRAPLSRARRPRVCVR